MAHPRARGPLLLGTPLLGGGSGGEMLVSHLSVGFRRWGERGNSSPGFPLETDCWIWGREDRRGGETPLTGLRAEQKRRLCDWQR